MPCYEFEGLRPVVDPTAFVHPSAILIGDAIVGPGCYVGPSASMRGDFGRLILEEGVNLQDNCTMHGFPGSTTLVKKNGHIGHGAVLHGCTVGENALVGMNAVVMDGAEIGTESIVAALAFVRAGFKGEARQLLVGSPAKPIRTLSDQDVEWKSKGTFEYQALAQRCLTSLHEVRPLHEVEQDRPRLNAKTDVAPLHQTKTDKTG